MGVDQGSLAGCTQGNKVNEGVWEGRTSCLIPNADLIARTAGDDFSLAFARIECHYFVNDGWLTTGRELLAPSIAFLAAR